MAWLIIEFSVPNAMQNISGVFETDNSTFV